jgi:hypothetical protein
LREKENEQKSHKKMMNGKIGMRKRAKEWRKVFQSHFER